MRWCNTALLAVAFYLATQTAFAGETPVGFWKLDGDAQDSAAAPHHGKLVGRAVYENSPVYASSEASKSQALWLNGVDAFAQIDSAPELNVGKDDFSLSVWILALDLRRSGIVSKGAGPGWGLSLAADGALKFETLQSPAGRVATGQWYHLVLSVKRGDAGDASKLYVNGELAAAGNIPAGNLDNEQPLLFGKISGDEKSFFSGLLDDVRLYKGAIDAAEVARLTDEGLPTLRRRAHAKTPFPNKFTLERGEVVVLTGGENLASERDTGYLETLMNAEFAPEKDATGIRVRNMAWEADTVYEQWRILNFGSWKRQLERVNAGVIFAQFGQMESLQGKPALDKFIAAYEKLLDEFAQSTQRIVLVTPMPFEKAAPPLPDQSLRNADVKLYADAIAQLANKRGFLYIDLTALENFNEKDEAGKRLTSNGVQLTPYGQWVVARLIAGGLGVNAKKISRDPSLGTLKPESAEKLRAAIVAKNKLWFDYWRPTNWAFLAGDRMEQPSSRDHKDARIRWFPAELQEYQALIQRAETKIDELARGVNK